MTAKPAVGMSDAPAVTHAPAVITAPPVTAPPEHRPPSFEVVLLKPHTHARQEFPVGATITINAAQRAWLIAEKVIAGDTLEK